VGQTGVGWERHGGNQGLGVYSLVMSRKEEGGKGMVETKAWVSAR